MLIDLAVSNYFRAMFAARIEMRSLWYTKDYQIEMFDMITQGLQPYLHACQNQLLKVIGALKAGKQASYRTSTLTHETYSRTDINLDAWGLPLLLALADITKEKQEQIDIDEIKHAMARHLDDINAESIPNSWIGYALARYGFNNKIHLTNGNRYNIERARVLTLLDEDLKA
jgi:hypothetical protein